MVAGCGRDRTIEYFICVRFYREHQNLKLVFEKVKQITIHEWYRQQESQTGNPSPIFLNYFIMDQLIGNTSNKIRPTIDNSTYYLLIRIVCMCACVRTIRTE